MFWLFWQLVGVVLGLLAICAIYWTTIALFKGAVFSSKAATLGTWKYREVIFWTLAIIVMSGGKLLARPDIIGLGFVFCVAAVAATATRHAKNGTIPFRCKCGAWVHLGKCPNLSKVPVRTARGIEARSQIHNHNCPICGLDWGHENTQCTCPESFACNSCFIKGHKRAERKSEPAF